MATSNNQLVPVKKRQFTWYSNFLENVLAGLCTFFESRAWSPDKSWRTHWKRVIPLFALPEDIRKVIYTTNATPSVNMTLRKVTRNHRIFPSDEAVYNVVYLAMGNIATKWTMPVRDWKPALNRFAVEFGERFPR